MKFHFNLCPKRHSPLLTLCLAFSLALRLTLCLALCLALSSCMKWDYGQQESLSLAKRGLFIINEGNFQYGNASLSFYNIDEMSVENEIFFRANGMRLGDVAQSMTIWNNLGWVVVNNSHVIFAIDLESGEEVGRITNLTSPRHIHFLSKHKAYVTQLWDNRITIVDPTLFTITGYIECPNMTMEQGSTEEMVQYGNYIFVNCWSYQNRILKIDTRTDSVVDELTVGIQPTSIVLDSNNKLWTVTDGGYQGSPYGYEAPALYRIDAESFSIEKVFRVKLGDSPSEIKINSARNRIYWINEGIWAMSTDAETLPQEPFVPYANTLFYGLGIDPKSGEIYVADAIDYQQPGIILRYSEKGTLIDKFYVGVIPGAFCWKEE